MLCLQPIRLAAQSKAAQPDSALLYAYQSWKARSTDSASACLLAEARYLKSRGRHQEAASMIGKNLGMSRHSQDMLLYELSLNYFVLKQYQQAGNAISRIKDSMLLQDKAMQLLQGMIYAEQGFIEQGCSLLPPQACDSLSSAYLDPAKARLLSVLLPGLGQCYAHKPAKGIASILLVGGLSTAAVLVYASGPYLFPSIFLLYPALRMYNGGKKQAENLAKAYNKNLDAVNKEKFRRMLIAHILDGK